MYCSNKCTYKSTFVLEAYDESIKEREAWQSSQPHDDVTTTRRRRKRSVSAERYVEMLVVVDKDMMDFYVNEDVMTYVLTIMNMVRANETAFT